MNNTARCILAGLSFCLVGPMFAFAQAADAGDAVAKETTAKPAKQSLRDRLNSRGPNHQRLDPLVGEWHTAVREWTSAEGEAIELTGTAECRWTLDGRFLEEHAEVATPQGGPRRSIRYICYDRGSELYEMVRMTNAATAIFTERGRYDPDSNIFRTTGTRVNPVSGVVYLTSTELKIESPDRHTLTAYITKINGVRWKQLETIYTRK